MYDYVIVGAGSAGLRPRQSTLSRPGRAGVVARGGRPGRLAAHPHARDDGAPATTAQYRLALSHRAPAPLQPAALRVAARAACSAGPARSTT